MSFTMPPTVTYGPHQIPTTSDMGKELWKHERKPDYRPENHPYPRMLYKAFKGEDGIVRCMDAMPTHYGFANMDMFRKACEAIEQFNLSCQKIVHSPEEQKAAYGEGWRESPNEARDAVMAWHAEMAQAAAERAYQDRNMSEKAQGEVAAAEAATMDVLPEIPEAPKRKRGRPRKEAVAS